MLKSIKSTTWAVLFIIIYASLAFLASLILGSERIVLINTDYSKPETWALSCSISHLAQEVLVFVVPAVISIFIYFILYKFVLKQSIIQSFGFSKTNIKSILIGGLIGVFTALLVLLVFHNDAWSDLIYKKQIFSLYDILKENDLIRIAINTILFYILGILPMITIIPVFDKILVRGLVLNKLRQNMPIILAVVLQALLFGITQLSLYNGIKAFAVGLLLGIIYVIAKSIWIPIIVHLIINASVWFFVEIHEISAYVPIENLIKYSSDTSSTYTDISITTIVLSIIIGVILSSILALLIYYLWKRNKTCKTKCTTSA